MFLSLLSFYHHVDPCLSMTLPRSCKSRHDCMDASKQCSQGWCVAITHPYCHNNTDCGPNGQHKCSYDAMCRCAESYVLLFNRCVLGVCVNASQCSGGKRCVAGNCTCGQGRHLNRHGDCMRDVIMIDAGEFPGWLTAGISVGSLVVLVSLICFWKSFKWCLVSYYHSKKKMSRAVMVEGSQQQHDTSQHHDTSQEDSVSRACDTSVSQDVTNDSDEFRLSYPRTGF